jgi:hypothetical protein
MKLPEDESLTWVLRWGIKLSKRRGDTERLKLLREALFLSNLQHCAGARYRIVLKLQKLRAKRTWKLEDPRMLREQVRVADAAYQHLHEQHKALESKCNDLRITVNNMAGALLEVAAHRTQDKDKNHVCWIGEGTFERVQKALNFIVSVPPPSSAQLSAAKKPRRASRP